MCSPFEGGAKWKLIKLIFKSTGSKTSLCLYNQLQVKIKLISPRGTEN